MKDLLEKYNVLRNTKAKPYRDECDCEPYFALSTAETLFNSEIDISKQGWWYIEELPSRDKKGIIKHLCPDQKLKSNAVAIGCGAVAISPHSCAVKGAGPIYE